SMAELFRRLRRLAGVDAPVAVTVDTTRLDFSVLGRVRRVLQQAVEQAEGLVVGVFRRGHVTELLPNVTDPVPGAGLLEAGGGAVALFDREPFVEAERLFEKLALDPHPAGVLRENLLGEFLVHL